MLIKVNQDWPDDLLLVNYELHNVCNYRCWYCFPNSNTGTYKWPDYELSLMNFIHLLNYYKIHLNKTRFQINLLGGEPTLWPKLSDFCKELKQTFSDISIMITTNGSKPLDWWYENYSYFDHILISCHPEYVNENHIISVANLLYDHNKHVDTLVLMAPDYWDRALTIIENLKSGKDWAIISSFVNQNKFTYSAEQLEYINDYLKQRPDLEWYKKVKTEYHYSVHITDETGTYKVSKTHLLINELNQFIGWECNIGIDNITVTKNGDISGSCGEKLYQLDFKYNLYDINFKNNFSPTIKPALCSQCRCFCEHEYNTSKHSNR